MSIVKECPEAVDFADPRAIKERQYADEYLDEMPNSAKSMNMRKRIIDGSRRALEKQYDLIHLNCGANLLTVSTDSMMVSRHL